LKGQPLPGDAQGAFEVYLRFIYAVEGAAGPEDAPVEGGIVGHGKIDPVEIPADFRPQLIKDACPSHRSMKCVKPGESEVIDRGLMSVWNWSVMTRLSTRTMPRAQALFRL
jgi:hypothetical protein